MLKTLPALAHLPKVFALKRQPCGIGLRADYVRQVSLPVMWGRSLCLPFCSDDLRTVIASAAWQSSLFAGLPAGLFSGLFYLDCHAALAMTWKTFGRCS